MAHRDDDEPGTVALRYEFLTGGPEGRNTLFAAREVLGFSHAEWDALPWHDQRMYAEGLAVKTGQALRAAPAPGPPRSGGHPPHDPGPAGVTAPVPPTEPGRRAGGGAEPGEQRTARAPDGTHVPVGSRLSGLSLPIRQATAPAVIAPPAPAPPTE